MKSVLKWGLLALLGFSQAQAAERISSVGSDTLASLMTLASEAFEESHPLLTFEVQSQGSSTAPPALIQGASDLGPMSRPMKPDEIEAFKRRYGYPPLQLPVAIDAIGVFANRSNPLSALTLEEVDAIFSVSRRCGAQQDIDHFESLGIKGRLGKEPITLYGRNSVSGTYAFFKEIGLCGGDFKKSVNEQTGNSSVVQSVGGSDAALGYSSLGYLTDRVRPLSIVKRKGQKPVAPTDANIASGVYPFSRLLYIYLNKVPGQPLDPDIKAFLQFLLSAEGQALVKKSGFMPLSRAQRNKALEMLD